MRIGWSGLLAMCLCVLIGVSSALAKTRVALVIGNSAYEHAAPLKNPKHDAVALAAVLKRLGFTVVMGVDLTRTQFEKTVRKFAKALRGADVGLFFYAGHGLQVKGKNYLAPIDAALDDEADLDFEALPVRTVLKQMERHTKTNLVILDACRNNPLARNLARSMGTRSAGIGRGLARETTGIGTLIAFATEPDNVALDGDGKNSPFTTALLRHIETPGLDVAQLMRRVRKEVIDETSGRQVPWNNSSLTGDFYFGGKTGSAPVIGKPKAAAPPPPPRNDRSAEITFWESIKSSTNEASFEAYLTQFPNGVFAPLARLEIQRLQREAKTALAPQRARPQPRPQPEERTTTRQAYLGPRVILAFSSQRRLRGSDLQRLGCKSLWVARNEIFDRNGYCFRTAKGRSYFDNSDCRTSSQNILTGLERQNVNLIVSWERRKGCR